MEALTQEIDFLRRLYEEVRVRSRHKTDNWPGEEGFGQGLEVDRDLGRGLQS